MTYASEVLADSPGSYFRHGEASGTTMTDSSGNGRNGTYVNTPTLGAPGLLLGDANTSVDFNGVNNYGEVASAAWMNATSFSVEAWCRFDNLGTSRALVVRDNDGSGGGGRHFQLRYSQPLNRIEFFLFNSGGTPYAWMAAPTVSTTYYFAGTYDGSQAILYVNGSPVMTHVLAGTFAGITQPLRIGMSGVNPMDGLIDETTFSPGVVLSPARVFAHYQAGASASPRVLGSAASDASVALGIDITSVPLTGLAAMATTDASVALRLVNTAATQNLIGGRDRQGQALATWEPPVVPPPAYSAPVYSYMSTQAWDSVSLPPGGVGPLYLVNYVEAEKPRTRHRIIIAGRDRTFWRGIATPMPSLSLIEPLLYGSGSLELPQVKVPWELPGDEGLEWLKPGAPVIIQSVDTATNTVVSTDWRGFLLDADISGGKLRWGLAGEVSGRAALQWHPQPLFKRRNDLGFWWSTAVTKAGGRFAPRGGPETGIELYAFGNTGRLDHMMELSAKGVNGNGAQWTCMPDANGVYRVTRKDRTTIHATAYLDDARTVANLRRDPAEEPNAVWGTYVTPSGMRVKNGVYPVLADTKAPAFPGALEEGDSGSGVTALIVRLAATGKLSYDDRPGGFDAEVTEAVKDVQDDADLPKTGIVNAATWAYLFDTPVIGYDIGGSHIEPLVQRAYRRRYKRTSGGNVSGDHPLHDRSRLPVDRFVDFGTNRKRREVMPWAKELLAPDDANNWAGTIVFNTHALIAGEHNPGDPLTVGDIMAAKDLKPGMNIWLPTWDGGTLVHVSGVDPNPPDGIVTVTVDTQARDTMTVWEVLNRNAENRRDPGRAWVRRHRSSGLTKDAVDEYDEVGGIISDTPLEAGWNVVPVVAGQSGTIGRFRLRLTPAKEFAVAVFGRQVTRGYLAARVPMPMSKAGGKRWTNESVRDELDAQKVSLYVAGDIEGPAGYSPLMKDSETEAGTPAPLTGRLDDDAGFEYRTFAAPSEEGADPTATYVLWMAIWIDSATILQGERVMWPLLESGA